MLTERQLEIVLAVVYEYIKTAEPVGSRTISRKFLKSHSAATIRNEMSDLSEMGYFSQPHSSAGRLPTSMAYRVYVNSILHHPSVSPPEIDSWFAQFDDRLQSVEDRLSEAARFLGRFTHCFSVAAVATVEGLKLRKVDFIRLAPDVLMILTVVENGSVQHSRVRIAADLPQDALERLAEVVNHVAVGVPWNSISDKIAEYMAVHMLPNLNELTPVFESLNEMMTGDGMTLSTGGMREVFASDNAAESPDRRDRLEAISALMDKKEDLENFLSDYIDDDGLKVTIGDENRIPEMQSCSVMMSTATDGNRKAIVGLVGPLRMNYVNSIAVIEAVVKGLRKSASESASPKAAKKEAKKAVEKAVK